MPRRPVHDAAIVGRMPELDAVEAKVVRVAVERFRAAVDEELGAPLRAELRDFRPPALVELLQELDIVRSQLSVGEPPFAVHEIHTRLLKSVVVHQRRALATEIDGPRQRTGNREAIRFLEKELRVLDKIVQTSWFSPAQPARLPRLTDFLSVRFAEQALGDSTELAPRIYDEKFGILEAPALFLSDLSCYRRRCRLRRVPICVGYLDIDDFKGFNSKYGETRVDRDLLPAFMELLEARAFGHGHAYRFGGDEYIVLLPNMDRAWATDFVRRFQDKLSGLSLPGIDAPPTVSAGLCPVGPDCFLTDREVQERANRAKNHAKAAGKNTVAAYRGDLYRDADIESPA